MSKEEFLTELASRIGDMPEKDREDALKYYGDYIDDAESVEAAIAELGTPESVARIVRGDMAAVVEEKPVVNQIVPQGPVIDKSVKIEINNNKKGKLPTWATITLTTLCIIFSPVILAFILAVFALMVLIMLLGILIPMAALTLLFGFGALGIIAWLAGFSQFYWYPLPGLLFIAGGLISMALALFMLLLTIFLFRRFTPLMFKLATLPFRRKKKNKQVQQPMQQPMPMMQQPVQQQPVQPMQPMNAAPMATPAAMTQETPAETPKASEPMPEETGSVQEEMPVADENTKEGGAEV